MHSQRTRWFWAASLLLALVHATLCNYYVPFGRVFSLEPLTGGDYDLHIGQVYRVVEGLIGWGRSWVYDVRLAAGQPEGTILDAGNKGWELWSYAWHRLGVPLPIAFNSFVLWVMLTAPLWIYAASRAFELAPGAALLAAAMTSTLWFFDSYLHWIWFVGMVSWAGASCLALLVLGLFYRLLTRERVWLALPCALCLGVCLLIHPYTFFALAPPMLALYLRGFRRRPRALHLAVAGVALFALALNAYWLRSAAAHWHYILDSGYYARGGLSYFFWDFLGMLRGADTGVIGVRTAFRFLYMALALAGLIALRRQHDARVLPWSVSLIALLSFAYLGVYLPGGAQVQPYRHLPAATLLAPIPAAAFVHWLVQERVFAGIHAGVKALLIVLGVALVQSLSAQVLFFTPRLVSEPAAFPDGARFPLSKYGFAMFAPPSQLHYGLPHDELVEPGANAMIARLQKLVPKGTRVLAEGAAFGERLAWRSELEVIGGFRERNVAQAYSNYFRMFEKKPATPAELEQYLKTFAIGWVVLQLAHPEFDAAKRLLEHVGNVGQYRVYRTLVPIDPVLHGRARVTARTNHIDVRASDPDQPLVLSYHFHETLRCTPRCSLVRVPNSFDRVGFIGIPAPHPAAFSIVNSYQW